jgi:hypothetical protein
MMDKQIFYYFNGVSKHAAVKVKPLSPVNSAVLFDLRNPIVSENKIIFASGKNYYDLIDFYESILFCVSERFKDIIDSNGLTGLDFYPLEYLNNERKYYGIRFKTHNVKLLHQTPYEMFFDIREWDGSDFFLFEGTRAKVCTEKAKLILEKNKVGGIRFVDYIRPVYPETTTSLLGT